MSDANTPTVEPDVITPGETLGWTKSLADYPATEWSLTYYFRGAGPGFDVACTADGSAHAAAVAAASTENCTPGQYYWEAWATKGAERRLVDEGRATVRKTLRTLSTATTHDERSQAERDLAAVRAALAGNLAAMEYTISAGGSSRTLRRFPRTELIALEKHLVARVNAERRRERVRRGGNYIQHIEVGFDNPR